MAVRFGIDRLLEESALRKPLAGRRVALLAHPASTTRDLAHSLDALAALRGSGKKGAVARLLAQRARDRKRGG